MTVVKRMSTTEAAVTLGPKDDRTSVMFYVLIVTYNAVLLLYCCIVAAFVCHISSGSNAFEQ